MTLIVELTVPDGWPIHITWAAMALAIMAYGAEKFSLDHLIRRAALPAAEPRLISTETQVVASMSPRVDVPATPAPQVSASERRERGARRLIASLQ
jgi:hypothetical protein